ncbi:hypothetical protein [Streptomyces sp. NPDC008125]|uniref:hypothetical protein n=1 Tax=Streptomyces sp. NPDC008125 TaxID=3364811 RepID=UPI0036E4FB9B
MKTLHISITLGSGPAFAGPGCVLCPSPRSGFGFSGRADTAQPATHRGFRLVRVLLALVSVLVLAWGVVYGHAVECVAAVIAAILVDATAALLRAGKKR